MHRHRMMMVVATLAAACSSSSNDARGPSDLNGAPPDGSVDAGADTGSQNEEPPDCDLSAPLANAPGCLSSAVGIFVSPNGNDAAAGTKEAPLRSIAQAVQAAKGKNLPRVYVCEGTFVENVALTKEIAIFGGLTCDWTLAASARPKIAPSAGIAVSVVKPTGAVHLETLDLVGSAEPGVPGSSAIGMFASEATDLTLVDVNVNAGVASAGSNGVAGSNYPATEANGGSKAVQGTRGGSTVCTCTDGSTSTGGAGAAGPTGMGILSGSATPAVGTANAGSSSATTCVAGERGADGEAGAQSVANEPGLLTSAGWKSGGPTAPAANGHPGQGGGGGGAKSELSLGGGGGACGGCGGAGGASGSDGGASFALLSYRSVITVSGGTLTASNGGAGGQGGKGQDGQVGGAGGGSDACSGGAGGSGAGGSGGAGGAGGPSSPVAYSGKAPTLKDVNVAAGSFGIGGGGGAAGLGAGQPGAVGPSGADGRSQPFMKL